jgi:hypothetical protein
LPFKHNFDGHLGESLRKRPGTRMVPALVGLAACVAFVLTLAATALAAPARAPRRAVRALPDSVIARLPYRDLTVREFKLAWKRVDARYRPVGTGLAQKRLFLDQVLERELIARAATAEPFVMTDIESAQYLATRDQAIQRALYTKLVVDSAVVVQADRDSARARLAASSLGKQTVPPEAVENYAHSLAEARRAEEFNARLKVQLAPAWDDSAAARLAREYGKLDPTKPDLSKPFALKLNPRVPALAPGDTGLVLVRSTAGDLTVGEFTRRFALLNPFQTDFPTTEGAVKARGEQFLGQTWFEQEAVRRGTMNEPDLLAAIANRREGIALDHYFARHVQAKIDTSEAVLKPYFDAHKERYAVPGHALVANVVTPGQATADSLVEELTAGAPWDSICARHVPEGPTRDQCGSTSTLPDAYPDTALVRAVRKLKPGDILAQALAPPNRGVVVLKMIEYVPFRMRPFDEGRVFAARDVAAEQTERLLQAELARLRKASPVTRNERALARVEL